MKSYSNRFVDVFPKFPPDACQIFGTISFLTTSSKMMNTFHSSTELFYAGFKPCLSDYKSSGDSFNKYDAESRNATLLQMMEKILVKPTDIMELSFKEVSLNKNFFNFTYFKSTSLNKTEARWIFAKKSN